MVYEEQQKANLHESAIVTQKHTVQLYVLTEDCNQPGYIKLMKGLCAGHGVSLFNGFQCRDSWSGLDYARLILKIDANFLEDEVKQEGEGQAEENLADWVFSDNVMDIGNIDVIEAWEEETEALPLPL
ncbi:uncharacterized protein LOC122721490 [Manihot esculenta]|uniref:uncharacterized protein LOC122721490 n=1 Tax=Manihot esculenta TaxID=3983 RepID=UPI001CC5374A|nr:uncharacterized protein LOC122721490 [Manihot esculenta]